MMFRREPYDPSGERSGGKPHARFREQGAETTYGSLIESKAKAIKIPQAPERTTPPLDSTNSFQSTFFVC